MARVKKDLLLLSVSGTKTVKLVDRTFNVNRRRALDIFRNILDRYGKAIPQGVRFHFEIAGDLLDDETLDLLASAPKGALQFEIGLQSFNQKTLEAVNRKTDIERLKKNIRRLVSFGNIHIHIDLIAGLPYEDFGSFAESFNTAYALKPHMLQLGFLKLLHGSPMRENPVQFPCEFSYDPPYQVTGTPWLTPDELSRLQTAEKALDRLYNSGRFRRTLDYALEQTGLTPFELFLRAGGCLAERAGKRMSLNELTALMLDFFSSLKGMVRAELRDAMACDRLATNAEGRLPEVLKVPDSRLKAIKTDVNTDAVTHIKKGVKRGFALLCAENAAVYADYVDKDPVTGEYELRTIPLTPCP